MAKEERGFKYAKRDKGTLKERANMRGGNFDSIIKSKYKMWKPKDGKNLIRILPPTWDDAKHYGLDIFVNYNIGVDNQSYLSLSKMKAEKDPLAEARKEAERAGNKELTKALQPNQRILYWLVDRNAEEEGPLLWAAPFTFDKSVANLCIDEDTKEVIYLDDPDKGRDLRFYKEGSGLLTKYDASKMKLLQASYVSDDEDQQQEWLDFVQDNSLPETLQYYDYEHISNVFDGNAGRTEDEDDEKPRGKKRPSRDEENDDDKPSRGRSRRDPDEDEDKDEKPVRGKRERVRDPEPDDEDEEKPVRGKRERVREDDDADEKPARRRRAPVEEDEDEEPPPRSRRGKADDGEDDDKGSLRDRIAKRRGRTAEPDDED